MLFFCSVAFLIAAFLAPDRYLPSGNETALQIGGEIEKLTEKIQVLKQEHILPPEKAQVLEKDLDRIRQEALGKDPAKTILFADCAGLVKDGTSGREHIIEESELYQPYFLKTFDDSVAGHSTIGNPVADVDNAYGTPSPSVHFRHGGMANVLWMDGRVTAKRVDFSKQSNWDGASPVNNDIGWFGAGDFSLWGDYR